MLAASLDRSPHLPGWRAPAAARKDQMSHGTDLSFRNPHTGVSVSSGHLPTLLCLHQRYWWTGAFVLRTCQPTVFTCNTFILRKIKAFLLHRSCQRHNGISLIKRKKGLDVIVAVLITPKYSKPWAGFEEKRSWWTWENTHDQTAAGMILSCKP